MLQSRVRDSPRREVLTLHISHTGIKGTISVAPTSEPTSTTSTPPATDTLVDSIIEVQALYVDSVAFADSLLHLHEGVTTELVAQTLEHVLDDLSSYTSLGHVRVICGSVPSLSTTLKRCLPDATALHPYTHATPLTPPPSSGHSTSSSNTSTTLYSTSALDDKLADQYISANNKHDYLQSTSYPTQLEGQTRLQLHEYLYRLLVSGSPPITTRSSFHDVSGETSPWIADLTDDDVLEFGYELKSDTESDHHIPDIERGVWGTLSRYWCEKWGLADPIVLKFQPACIYLLPPLFPQRFTKQAAFLVSSKYVDTLLVPLPLTSICEARAAGAKIESLSEGNFGVWEDLIIPKIRRLMRDKYANGKWTQYDQLIGLMPPGGSLGLDDKLFSIVPNHQSPLGQQTSSWARDGVVRFEGGGCTHSYRDPRADPRCLLESQVFGWRAQLDELDIPLDSLILIQGGQNGPCAQRVISQIMRLPVRKYQPESLSSINSSVSEMVAKQAASFFNSNPLLTNHHHISQFSRMDTRPGIEYIPVPVSGVVTPPGSEPCLTPSSYTNQTKVDTGPTTPKSLLRHGLYTPPTSTRTSFVDIPSLARGLNLQMTPVGRKHTYDPSSMPGIQVQHTSTTSSGGESEEVDVEELLLGADEGGSWKEGVYIGLGQEYARLRYIVEHHYLLPPPPPPSPSPPPEQQPQHNTAVNLNSTVSTGRYTPRGSNGTRIKSRSLLRAVFS